MTETNNASIANNNAVALQAELDRLRAENATLKAAKHKQPTLGLKVSEKGAVSVYGLGRFPVTLYPTQWEKVFGLIDTIRAFIEENRSKLKFEKDESPASPPAGA